MTESDKTIDLLDVIATARSIRRYHFEPIPEEDLNKILWAATRAPSGTNRQPFRFLVLRHGDTAKAARTLLGDAFRRNWEKKRADEGWEVSPATGKEGEPPPATNRRQRMIDAMQFFVDHFEEIPVIVLACFVRYRKLQHQEGASVFPACQNLLLAARALGYGACFSGWHLSVEEELRDLLEIPEGVELSLTITLGKPRGSHGPLRRRPLAELVFEDRWEQPATWAKDPAGSRLSRSRRARPAPQDP